MNTTRFKLVRFAHTPYGTFGLLYFPGDATLPPVYTVEPQWMNNKPFVSCIPNGIYKMQNANYYNTEYPYDCLEILHVPDRTDIKIHRANLAEELQGCIAPGIKLGWYKNQWAVVQSTVALYRIMGYVQKLKAYGDEGIPAPWEIEITDTSRQGLFILP